MCTHLDDVARHAQRVKLCNGATSHVEHGIDNMLTKSVRQPHMVSNHTEKMVI